MPQREMDFICRRRVFFKPGYKQAVEVNKLVFGIFFEYNDSETRNENLVKLCEYASSNPRGIPKITKLLEARFWKALRHGSVRNVVIAMDAYNMLLSMCGERMALFASSLLTLIDVLMKPSREVCLQILGCQMLTRFIYSQPDRSYAHIIDRSVKTVCELARENKQHGHPSLSASSLQCLASMVWYMDAFFRASDDIAEVVQVMLDHYEDEEGKSGAGLADTRPPPEKKHISSLTSEEIEELISDPRIWAQICLQNMAELGKESTTMRQILAPMFQYFDTENQWSPQQGLAIKVLWDMALFAEEAGKQWVILKGIIRHLDQQNVAHDLALKSCVAQVAAVVARQITFLPTFSDVWCVRDILTHLRKSLQITTSSEGDTAANIHLRYAITCCLLEIAKGIKNPLPLFNVIVISLEDMPSNGVAAQETLASLLTLAHVVVAVCYNSQQAFPEALLYQLLKAMVHPDRVARIFAHLVFSVLLSPNHVPTMWNSRLDSVQKETNGGAGDSTTSSTSNNNSILNKVCSTIARIANEYSFVEEPSAMELSEYQTSLLLCSFWVQFNFSGNLPSNFVAIARSYCLTLMSSDIKSPSDSNVQIFQLPLSLRKKSLSSFSGGKLSPACRRGIVVTSTAMVFFALSRLYQMEMDNPNRPKALYNVDPYLSVNERFEVCVRPDADIRQYGSAADNQAATYFLSKTSEEEVEFERVVLRIIAPRLCCTLKMEVKELLSQLSAPFSADESLLFAPMDVQASHRNQAQNLDHDPATSSQVEADVTSALRFINVPVQKVPLPPSSSGVMGAHELSKAADEVAAQLEQSEPTTPPSLRAMAAEAEAYRSRSWATLLNTLSSKGRGQGESGRVDHEVKVPTLPPFHKYEFSDEKLRKFEMMDDLLQNVREQQRQQEQQQQQQ